MQDAVVLEDKDVNNVREFVVTLRRKHRIAFRFDGYVDARSDARVVYLQVGSSRQIPAHVPFHVNS